MVSSSCSDHRSVTCWLHTVQPMPNNLSAAVCIRASRRPCRHRRFFPTSVQRMLSTLRLPCPLPVSTAIAVSPSHSLLRYGKLSPTTVAVSPSMGRSTTSLTRSSTMQAPSDTSMIFITDSLSHPRPPTTSCSDRPDRPTPLQQQVQSSRTPNPYSPQVQRQTVSLLAATMTSMIKKEYHPIDSTSHSLCSTNYNRHYRSVAIFARVDATTLLRCLVRSHRGCKPVTSLLS